MYFVIVSLCIFTSVKEGYVDLFVYRIAQIYQAVFRTYEGL